MKKMIIGIFALLISIGSFWFSFKFIKTYFEVKSWTKVQAAILSKNIRTHTKNSNGRQPFAVEIKYKYTYNNIEYQNDKVFLVDLQGGQANHTEENATEIVKSLGDKVQIYLNSNNPSQSVIFCDGLGLYLFVAFIGFIAFIIALFNFFK